MATTVENGNTYITYESAGETTFSIPFPFLEKGHIKVSVNDVVQVQDTAYSVDVGAGSISFSGPTTSGENVKIWRNTEWLTRLVDFASGSQVTETDLDTSALQLFYIIQELIEDNIAGTVTIDIGPGGGGGGSTGIGGVNVIDQTLGSDTNTIALGTSGLSKSSLLLYRNGVFVPPADWEINVDGDTITTDYNFLTGDKVNVLYLFGSIVTTINTSVITTASILDGAITTTKIADGAVTGDKILDGTIQYKDHQAPSGVWDGDWGTIDGTDSVTDLLADLNARVAVLEAAAVGDQIEIKTTTMDVSSSLSDSVSFSFTPDYVLVIWDRATTTGVSANDGDSSVRDGVLSPGQISVLYPGSEKQSWTDGGATGTNPLDFIGIFTLTGSTLTITSNSTGTLANLTSLGTHRFRFIAVKEA